MGDYCIKDGYEHRTVNTTIESDAGDYWAPTRVLLSRYAQYAVYAQAAQLVQQKQLQSVVDVGCGMGHKLIELVEPHARRIVGVEQPTAVEVAKKLHPGTHVEFRADDLEKPEQSNLGTFDLVLCVDVVEHLVNPDMLLDYLRQRCHERSWMIISTPERDVRRGPDCMKSPKKEHVREWNRAEFAQYLGTRGFNVIEHKLLPAFRVGWSRYMIKERLRLLRKGISLNYSQMAICQLA